MLNCHPISHSALKRVLRNTTAIVLPKNWQVTSAKTASMQAPQLISVLDPFTLKLRFSLQLSVSFSKALWKSWPHNVVHSQGKFPRWGYFSVDEGQGCRAEQNSPSFSCISHLEKLMLYIFQSICLLEAETEAKFSRCVRSVGGRAIQSCLHIQPNHIQGLFLQPCRLGGKSFTPWLGREIIQYPLGDVLHYVQIQTKIIGWIPSYFLRLTCH